MNLSIIIPAYNEESQLPKTIECIRDYLHRLQRADSTEVIVVDDGSSDSTRQIVADSQKTFQNLRLLQIFDSNAPITITRASWHHF